MRAPKNPASKPCAPELTSPAQGAAAALTAAGEVNQWVRPVLFGFALSVAHLYLDLSLGLPGHFGLIWMAGLMASRLSCSLTGAASMTVVFYALGNMGLHWTPMHTLTHAPQYLVAAMVVDALWPLARRVAGNFRRPTLVALATVFLMAGLAYMLKPVTNLWVGGLFGLSAKSLQQGLAFPMAAHFCFGATGAVIGLLIWQRIARPRTDAGA